ncbi:MAG: hypothetical protein HRT57_00745 [Crocinitomicaceae bacterium]|nr:hypothetical protein [Crocinitomicaceae bacterium]
MINEQESGKTIHVGSKHFIKAKYEIDLKLYKLEVGEYHMIISFNEINKSIYFVVA